MLTENHADKLTKPSTTVKVDVVTPRRSPRIGLKSERKLRTKHPKRLKIQNHMHPNIKRKPSL
jgi:hypothetical protein